MDIKKVITLTLIGIGVYLLLTRREAKAEEASETPAKIPTTPQAPDNPAISMVNQIIKEIEEKYKIVTPSLAPSVCKQVKFKMKIPFTPIRALIFITMKERTAVETICGPSLKAIQVQAESRAQTIFSPLKATFEFLD